MQLSAGKLRALSRLADQKGFFKMTAVDQRPPIMNLIQQKKNVAAASYEDVAAVKASFTKVLAPAASAMLLDPIWAYPNAYQYVSAQQGLIMTLEAHDFSEDDKGRRSHNIPDWSVAKIKAMGADAVKALAWYRPDADQEVCRHQQAYVREIGEACRLYDIPFVFELLVYPLAGEANQTQDYIEHASKQAKNVIDSVKEFAKPEYGVDVFKLESPVPANQVPEFGSQEGQAVQALFDELGALSPVPWVMLSAGANMHDFYKILQYAYQAGASGYLAGRAIWLEAAQHYPNLSAMEKALHEESLVYMQKLNQLTEQQATPWFKHKGRSVQLVGADQHFPRNYQVGF